MELHIKDRLYFPQILPQKGSFLEFNMKKEILNRIAITEEERKKFNIQENEETHTITWNPELDKENPITVEFSKQELEYITKGIESISSSAYPDDFWAFIEKVYDAINA